MKKVVYEKLQQKKLSSFGSRHMNHIFMRILIGSGMLTSSVVMSPMVYICP